MTLADDVLVALPPESLLGKLPDGLEHPESGSRSLIAAANQAVVEEREQRGGVRTCHLFHSFQGAAAHEDGEAPERRQLLRVEQRVTPFHRGAKRSLPRISIPLAWKIQHVDQAIAELFNREQLEPRRRKLHRQREVIESLAEVRQGCGGLDVHADGVPPRDDESLGVARGHRWNRELVFGVDVKWASARYEEGGTFSIAKDSRQFSCEQAGGAPALSAARGSFPVRAD